MLCVRTTFTSRTRSLGRLFLGPSAIKSTLALRTTDCVTVATLQAKYKNSEPITAVTAYDYPSAKQVRSLKCAVNITDFVLG